MRIRVCENCGQLNAMNRVTGEAYDRVFKAANLDLWELPVGWELKIWGCRACHTPIVEIYPERIAERKRAALLGVDMDDSPLKEKGGG